MGKKNFSATLHCLLYWDTISSSEMEQGQNMIYSWFITVFILSYQLLMITDESFHCAPWLFCLKIHIIISKGDRYSNQHFNFLILLCNGFSQRQPERPSFPQCPTLCVVFVLVGFIYGHLEQNSSALFMSFDSYGTSSILYSIQTQQQETLWVIHALPPWWIVLLCFTHIFFLASLFLPVFFLFFFLLLSDRCCLM